MTIFPIIWEIINVRNVSKVHNFIGRIKKSKDLKFDEITTNQKVFSVMIIGYIVWIITGLFTFQWPIFVCFLVIGMIPKIYAWYRWVDSFIKLVALIFVIINAYHLQIDVNTFIIKLITSIFKG